MLVQRDTYFRVPDGRLKLREETPGRRRADPVRTAPTAPRRARAATGSRRWRTPTALREALDAALGTLVVVDKERRLLLWEGVRDPPRHACAGSARFLELEGVAPEDSDLSGRARPRRAAQRGARARRARILADSYSDRCWRPAGSERARSAAARAAHGARLRAVLATTASASPCARPTAPCTSAPTSRTPPTRWATARRRRRSARWSPPGATQIVEAAVIGDGEEPCVPCGGCRQRLREFMPLDATVHLLADEGSPRGR